MTTFDSTRVNADLTLSGGNLTATHSTSVALSATVQAGGTAYVVNDILTVSGGTFTTAAQFKVTAVSSGVVTTVALQTAGSYTVTPANPAATTGGTGSGCTLNVTYTGADDIAPGDGYHSSGQWTFTITFGAVTSGHTQFGMCGTNTSVVIGQHLGQTTSSCGLGAGTGQMFNLNGGVTIAALSFLTNAVVDAAVDLTNMLIWLRINGGSWNANSTAVPGVSGGLAINATGATGNLFTPAANIYTLNDSAVLNTTKNLGLAGFLPWDPPVFAQSDGATVVNLSGTSASFVLDGGAYSFEVVVTAGGTIALQQLGPDGATWVNSFAALSASGIQAPLFLPPGTYRFNGGTGNYTASVQRIKYA